MKAQSIIYKTIDNQVAIVYETHDYSVFKKLEYNRDVSTARVNKIKASFLEGEILNPIIVNEKFEVIDGQGRLQAKKELNRPVQYIVVHGLTILDCQRLNKYTTRWTNVDFIGSYMKAGNENYILLNKAMKDTHCGSQRVLRLANRTMRGNQNGKIGALEKGTLTFTKEDYEKVVDIFSFSKLVIDSLQETGKQNDAFYSGISVMLANKDFDRDRFIENCKKCRGAYAQASGLENQLKEYSRIYNYKRSPQNRLYFEDYMRNRGWNVRNY